MIKLLELSNKEWFIISDIILNINAISVDKRMKEAFFENLENIISFNSGTFYFGHNSDRVKSIVDPVIYKHPYHLIKDPQIKEYDKYQDIDCVKWMYSLPHSTVYRETDLLQDSIRENTELYKKIYKPLCIHYAAGVNMVYDNIFLGAVNLFKSKENGDFTEKDIFILDYLKPHLTHRMFQLHPQAKNQIVARNAVINEYNLTDRELEIITLISEGISNKEISEKLFICEDTVKKHISHIYKKMNVSSRSKIVKMLNEKNYRLHTFKHY